MNDLLTDILEDTSLTEEKKVDYLKQSRGIERLIEDYLDKKDGSPFAIEDNFFDHYRAELDRLNINHEVLKKIIDKFNQIEPQNLKPKLLELASWLMQMLNKENWRWFDLRPLRNQSNIKRELRRYFNRTAIYNKGSERIETAFGFAVCLFVLSKLQILIESEFAYPFFDDADITDDFKRQIGDSIKNAQEWLLKNALQEKPNLCHVYLEEIADLFSIYDTSFAVIALLSVNAQHEVVEGAVGSLINFWNKDKHAWPNNIMEKGGRLANDTLIERIRATARAIIAIDKYYNGKPPYNIASILENASEWLAQKTSVNNSTIESICLSIIALRRTDKYFLSVSQLYDELRSRSKEVQFGCAWSNENEDLDTTATARAVSALLHSKHLNDRSLVDRAMIWLLHKLNADENSSDLDISKVFILCTLIDYISIRLFYKTVGPTATL